MMIVFHAQAWEAVLEMTGPCVALEAGACEVVRRINRLFFLNEGQGLSHVQVADMGILKYPPYKVHAIPARGRGSDIMQGCMQTVVDKSVLHPAYCPAIFVESIIGSLVLHAHWPTGAGRGRSCLDNWV